MKAMPISALIALSLLAFSLFAFAEQPATVGELLDKGGKKLTKDELARLVTGATIGGIAASDPNWKFQYTYKDDGSVSGNTFRFTGAGVATTGASTTRISGKWSLNEQGQLCSDTTNSFRQKYQRCDFYFSLGTAYFSSPTDDRTAALLEREVQR